MDNAGISVLGDTMVLHEIILDSGHYIPIQKEPYASQKHKLDPKTNNSYMDIDSKLTHFDNIKLEERKYYITNNDYKKMITELFFQKAYVTIMDDNVLFNKIRTIIDHPIKLRIHKSEEIYKLLNPTIKAFVQFKNELVDLSLDDEEKNKLIIRNTFEFKNKELYHKLICSFIDLLIIYDVSDYDRFLQIDISLIKIKQQLKPNELLFTHSDIVNDSYLEHFIPFSQYIRNVSLYGEGISKSKLIQINKQQAKKR